jgi:hypothetical protein
MGRTGLFKFQFSGGEDEGDGKPLVEGVEDEVRIRGSDGVEAEEGNETIIGGVIGETMWGR